MWYYKFIFFVLGSWFFVSCSEKKEITICECAEINVKIGFRPYDDLNDISRKLIEEKFGKEYLECEVIIKNWKLQLKEATKEEKDKMINELYRCVQDEALDRPLTKPAP